MLLTLPNEPLRSISDKVNTAGRGQKTSKKKKKTIKGGIFPVRRKFQTKLPFWMCGKVCKSVFLFSAPEKQTTVWLQRSAAPDSTFTLSLLADSSSATRSLAVCCCCCCHRARRTHSLYRHRVTVPDWTFKIIKKNLNKNL